MKTRLLLTVTLISIFATCAMGQETSCESTSKADVIELPAPNLTDTMTVGEALANRCSIREYDIEKSLDMQTLSNLLWAAWGFNREDKRTAPTALDKQDIRLYVFLQQGAYLYDARTNQLQMIAKGDYRKFSGKQPFVNNAPVNIVFVSDTRLLKNETMSAVGCGAISQNIYLYCASAGLGSVVRGSFDSQSLSKILKLKPFEKVLLAQTVGYPAQ